MKIEVLISTLNDGIQKISLGSSNFSYLIVHQVTNNLGKEYQDYYDSNLNSDELSVRYLQMSDLGLSKSRNFALSHSQGEILWVMDDDVKILPHSYDVIAESFKSTNCDILVVSHSDKFTTSKLQRHGLNLFNSSSVASIDICLRRDTVLDKVNFDENFGLGSGLPSGEEYIFITDSLKLGLSAIKQNTICSLHPIEASGNDYYSSYKRVDAKHKMLKRIFNYMGTPLFILFSIKKSFSIHPKRKVLPFLRFMCKSIIGQ